MSKGGRFGKYGEQKRIKRLRQKREITHLFKRTMKKIGKT